ncbi:MAG: hypothetical protein HKN25_06625 [Pyrinomonadaceae bacterium]|nr:hypothetical protein [Pyrinomonadaceae bacterium]
MIEHPLKVYNIVLIEFQCFCKNSRQPTRLLDLTSTYFQMSSVWIREISNVI